jgi:hypothetical protein
VDRLAAHGAQALSLFATADPAGAFPVSIYSEVSVQFDLHSTVFIEHGWAQPTKWLNRLRIMSQLDVLRTSQ